MKTVSTPKRKERSFLPEDFKVGDWEQIQPYFDDLQKRNINSVDELKAWFRHRSELESILSEDLAWRYIRMTCNTADQSLVDSYTFFVKEIEPKVAPLDHALNKKVLSSEFLKEIEKEKGYDIMIRNIRRQVEIFRKENIPLKTEIQTESQKFGQISGAMTVEVDGKELTLQQAAVHLQSTNRELRKEVYFKIADRRMVDLETLDNLFSKLVRLRHRMAVNANFANFRDYMFAALGRFDYTPADCFDFHRSVETSVVPLLDDIAGKRKEKLGVKQLKPWDKAVDQEGKEALKPFESGDDLIKKTIQCFHKLDPFLGQCLEIMQAMGYLDLESRKGKAPGGYNYPMAEIGVPFIFMNATSTLRDMVTILHEGGHAVHSFLTRNMELNSFKSTPSEVAELASMAMELISMDHWDLFFDDEDDLRRARVEHLEQIIETLPWVATIDKFQHWVYENPGHSFKERKEAWNSIFNAFSDKVTDWTGCEKYRDYLWQKQLHLYEVPFYYIEYGMAQLGAIAVWRNFKEDRQKGLNGYISALKLGYTHTIPEIYEAARIRFDFSKEYISELMGFVRGELRKIEK